jgi:hypothetical protein
MEQQAAIQSLAKQVKLLKIYAFALTLVLLGFIAFYLTNTRSHFKEITAERLNIVEANGKLRMVISNKENQHPGRMDNKDWPKRDRPAGMIFFNDVGDECGGLIYDGDKSSSSMTYSIDQYKNDQIMQLQYAQDGNSGTPVKSYGLKLWDRSDKFTLMRLSNYYDSLKRLKDTATFTAGMAKLKAAGLMAKQRLFVGKADNGEVGLFLNDAQGRPRLKICINKQNQPVIQTLDDKGTVIASR